MQEDKGKLQLTFRKLRRVQEYTLPKGIEPLTLRLTASRSNQLS